MDCKRIHEAIRKVVLVGAMQLQLSDLDLVSRKRSEKGLDTGREPDLRWRLLSSNWNGEDCKLLLGKAVDIFHVRSHLLIFSLTDYCVSLITIFLSEELFQRHIGFVEECSSLKKKKKGAILFLV